MNPLKSKYYPTVMCFLILAVLVVNIFVITSIIEKSPTIEKKVKNSPVITPATALVSLEVKEEYIPKNNFIYNLAFITLIVILLYLLVIKLIYKR